MMQYAMPEGLRSNIIPKNIVKVYEELEDLGFPVKWTLPSRVFVIEDGPARFAGLKNGRRTFTVPRLIRIG